MCFLRRREERLNPMAAPFLQLNIYGVFEERTNQAVLSARNINAKVILYADKITQSMQKAMNETSRRREVQLAYNLEHGITPRTVTTAIQNLIEDEIAAHEMAQEVAGQEAKDYVTAEYLEELQVEMLKAAQELDFERAAELRDKIAKLKGESTTGTPQKKGRGRKRSR